MPRGTPIITSFTGGETSPLTNGRVDQESYFRSLDELTNFLINIQGPATKRPGTKFISEVYDSDYLHRLIPFQYSETDNCVLEFGDYTLRFYTAGGIVMYGGSPYEINTPYADDDLYLLKFVQSADVMYIVHPLYEVRKLTRNDVDDWTLSTLSARFGPFQSENTSTVTLTPSATTGTITITASAGLFTSTWVGEQILFNGDREVITAFTATGAGTSLMCPVGESLVVSITGTWVGTIALQRSADNATWRTLYTFTANTSFEVPTYESVLYYRLNCTAYTSGTCTTYLTRRDVPGYVTVTAYTNATTITASVGSQLPSTSANSNWFRSAFRYANGYPEAVAFFEQRLIFAGTTAEPSTIWASKVDDYESFRVGTTAEDFGYSYTLAGSRVNQILWLLAQRLLFVGTMGDEWKFGSTTEATTFANVDARKESEYGSAPIQPIIVDGVPIFVGSNGTCLRAITYTYEEDSFRAPSISDHAEHMLQAGISDIALQQIPNQIIWMVRTDGKLVACTFSRASKIMAFSLHDVGGVVESIAVIRGDSGDELWMVMKRGTKRYVEQMQPQVIGSVDDAFHVDSGLSYDDVPATVFGGLGHLIGETVSVFADGEARPDVVVDGSGNITLAESASKVVAGLPFQAVLKTKPFDIKGGAGTTQGKPKGIFSVSVRLKDTLECNVGYEDDQTHAVKLDGDPVVSFTGDKRVSMKNRGTDSAQIVVESSQPVPLTVISIAPTMYATEL